jgi:uncharacterized NAD-dependent epimerase/dehydratase family protein
MSAIEEKSGFYYSLSARLAIYAPDALSHERAKTAEGMLRYGSNPVVAVIDRNQAGKTVKEATGIASPLPIVATIEEALALKPDALLLGTAWAGGGLPPEWKPDILKALDAGLDIINGLHDFLADDPELSAAALRKGARLIDVRRVPDNLPVATAAAISLPSFIVLTVGSDCSVGKMTTCLELARVAGERQKTSAFVATGQTGIMICGRGVAIDRVAGDFMAGAVEQMVVEASPGNDYIFVEGQGSIVHPSFSGVTLAIMHGSCPQGLILCHNARRSKTKGLSQKLLPLPEFVAIYETMCAYIRPAKVLGVALNTYGLSEQEAIAAITTANKLLGLPVCDPVRQGARVLFDAIEKFRGTLK